MRSLVAWAALCAALGSVNAHAANVAGLVGLDGNPRNPFASAARARVFIFARTDCPITNRYAPELARLAAEFHGAEFWMVYPDPKAAPPAIKDHMAQYAFPGTALRDLRHELAKLAHATIAPEAAVFDASGKLMYHGRIDDRWISPGTSRPAAQVHDLEDAIKAVVAGRPPAVAETRAIGCWLADVE